MKKTPLTTALTCALRAATPLRADNLSTTGKPAGQGNPLTPMVFCADPTAVEYDGRLYVYGTNDQQSFDLRGSGTDINYGVYHGTGWDFDTWQFLPAPSAAVVPITPDAAPQGDAPDYDLTGRRQTAAATGIHITPRRHIYIKQ